MPGSRVYLQDDPLWYKDAIIYELHIKAFCDGNNDGIGDFEGLCGKLDYLKDLGINAIWLLPFYPSPRRDDGYDIADFFDVHADYGRLKDFREFMKEAHRRGIRVITELVLNHTSDQHPWFQRARRARQGSSFRNFYVWSDTPDRYLDARIIFQDFETSNWTWDPVARAYYWHRFYSHQPDLNYENPQVQKAILRVIDFWMKLGVDGVRLDAVPYLYEREGTNCENLPETYDFLRKLRTYLDGRYRNRMLLAEANQWPEDAVAYFGNGDECHMAFHFPLMPRMFMALEMEDSFPIIDILDTTPIIPEVCQWALFLRNHDELTLEMVTDEERDYMYRMYAKDPKARINLGIRRRLAPLLDNDRRKIKLMYALLFSLPGTPVIYYGDELGMGDNYYLGDRDGVRTPMQWSSDRNSGFSRANPQQLYLPVVIDPEFHFTSVNVEAQEKHASSFLWWIRRFIAMRKHHKVFGRGSIEILYSDNPKVFAFIRQYEEERVLMAVNLSRHAQIARFDLSNLAGNVPEEMFSRNEFEKIRESPYALTLSPYGWYLFLLKMEMEEAGGVGEVWPEVDVPEGWEKVFEGKEREILEGDILPGYVGRCRWFGGKARKVQEFRISEVITPGRVDSSKRIVLLEVEYSEGLPETYLLPLAFAAGEEAERIAREYPQAVVCRLKVDGTNGFLYDGLFDDRFCLDLLSLIARKRKIRMPGGELVAYPGRGFKNAIKGREYLLKPQILKTEQSNTSVLFGEEFFLKIYRHLEEGINPDLEMGRFLTERARFPHVPAFAGGIEYRRQGSEPVVIGILQNFVPNQSDSWRYFLDMLNSYFERVLTRRNDIEIFPESSPSIMDLAEIEVPAYVQDLMTTIPIEMAGLLGKRTAELHCALSSDSEEPDFSPEPFSVLWQRSIYQSMQSLTKRVFRLLRNNLQKLPADAAREAAAVLEKQKQIVELMRAVTRKKLAVNKIRIHGDYHLGQVLYTGKDFVMIDFEGEPARTLSERRLKRSPLRDVAGMLRSFHYAASLSLLKEASLRPDDRPFLQPWADAWYRCVAGAFLRSYLEGVEGTGIVPKRKEDTEVVLKAFVLEKAVYELGYELNNRPEWVVIPMRGIMHLLHEDRNRA